MEELKHEVDLKATERIIVFEIASHFKQHLPFMLSLAKDGSRDFEKVGHSIHGWPTKKILGFGWSKKTKITLETKVFGKTYLSVFSNFLHFNESLPMKSYQFFKIYIRFYKKREKTLIQQSIKKEKLRKFGLCFI